MTNPNPNSPYNPYLEADKLFFEADQKIKEAHIPEALELLLDVAAKYPEYGRAYNHLGFLYETKYRNYQKAEEYYQKALQHAPEYPATYLNYAALLSTLEKFQELETLLTKALTTAGISKDKIYNEFGIMCELQGKYEEAIDYFRKVIRYSLSDQDIAVYKKNIDRCKMKIQEEFMF